jgi:hypothetical protein
MQINPQLELARKFILYTGRHVFLTGKAGTGKTTFLHQLREKAEKRMVVVAPTGVAAINARGVTIHSFFQLAPGMQIGFDRMKSDRIHINKQKINIMRSIDLLVIDEISMVRADLLDAIDVVLRRFRNHSKPFGGIQLLMIGDLQQLPPIVKDDEKEIISAHYETPYFFSSNALKETSFISIELTHVFRQQDGHFISILNKVRDNCLDSKSLNALNQRYIPNYHPADNEGYIILCTHNAQAARINDNKLNELQGRTYRFKAIVEGIFPEYSYPTDLELVLKKEAQVMFVKNDTSADKHYYNGKVGKIISIRDDEIRVLCPGEKDEIIVKTQKWDNVKYGLDGETQEIHEVVEGSFTQIPLKLAWAITIHKSQGLTFEHAMIDAEAAFAHGQVYVALSRCKTLEGLILSTPIHSHSIINDRTVCDFTHQIEQNQPDENLFQTAQTAYQHEQVKDLFHFNVLHNRISYINRIISENSGSIPKLTSELFHSMQANVQTDILDFEDKFQQQINLYLLNQADVSLNMPFQERIGKASVYFSGKIQADILDRMSKADIDIDNKTVKKQLNEAVSRLENDARIKYDCLSACLSGFNLSEYLHAKALAAIEKEKPEKSRIFSVEEVSEIAHPKLFERLRMWRSTKAKKLNLPPYVIFSQKALYGLVQYLPTDRKSLLLINGIGRAKADQYGADIINIIKTYCEETGIQAQVF